MYSVFTLWRMRRIKTRPSAVSRGERAGELARLFADTNVTVLELAATVDWLWREERSADWRSEITRRKGVKVRAGRLDEAVGLLKSIGLEPPPPNGELILIEPENPPRAS